MGRSSQQGRKTRLRLRSRLNLLTFAQREGLWRQSTWIRSRKAGGGQINLCYFAWSASSCSKALPSHVPTLSLTTSVSTAAPTRCSPWTRWPRSTRCTWSLEASSLAPSAQCSSSRTTKTSQRYNSSNIHLSRIWGRLKVLNSYYNIYRHRKQWLKCRDIRR